MAYVPNCGQGREAFILPFLHDGSPRLYGEGDRSLLFTENDTYTRRLYGPENGACYFKPLGGGFGRTFARRFDEADEFYAGAIPGDLSADAKSVMRQSLAGLLRSKQFYD